MRSSPLEELVKFLEEDISAELESENLASWLLNTCNKDLATTLQEFSQDQLEAIKEDLLDGAKATISVDISDFLLEHLESIASEEEDSSEEDEYEDYEEDDNEDDDDY